MRLHGYAIVMGAGAAVLAMVGCANGPQATEPVAVAQVEEAEMTDDVVTEGRAGGEVREASWRVREPEDRRQITGDTVRLTVHGMSCPKCANNIERQVERVVGVSTINIDMGQGHVLVGLRPTVKPSPRDLAQAITRTGFTLVEIAER